ncbi:glycine cleavage system protein R [uncultured Cocleimonas sp.]|uniref:glycine cleavage system protein R n=1 Tax=uncultured Cocleimonas sp. TaxID=1051587 RepID=UPI00261C68A7|nr:ACT domain-containing protein [uncultured Cocleimonas sp.]
MQVSLIITILGPDKPGLVKSLSETLNKFGASWTESRMAHLAGKFAGLLQVSLPTENLEPLTKAINELETDIFKIHIEQADLDTMKPEKILKLELLGQDRPGIIHDITQQLSKLEVNIEELESHIREASMSGEILFCAELTLGLPVNVTTDEVQDILEDMSDQFMIDVNFSS